MVPSEREHAVAVGRAPGDEVIDDRAGRVAEASRTGRGDPGDGTGPERRRGGKAVDEAAPLQEGRAVTADEVHGVEEEAVQPRDVDGATLVGQLGRPRHAGPEHGVDVQGPADVVVEGALVAVRQPAVLPHEGIVAGEIGGDVGRRPRTADRAQERLHDDAEPHPVRLRVGVVAHDGGEVGDDPIPRACVEGVPDPLPRQIQGEGEGCRLDLGLSVLVDPHPAVGRVGVDPRPHSFGEEGDQLVDALPARSRDAETGEEENPGEALETVDGGAVPARVAREDDAPVTVARLPHRRVQQRIGDGKPVAALPTGEAGKSGSRHGFSFEGRPSTGVTR